MKAGEPSDHETSNYTERPDGAGRSRAERGPACLAGLPCQNRNNSTEGYRFFERPDSVGMVQSSDGRSWVALREDTFVNLDALSTAERKAAFQLRGNIDSFVGKWGAQHCAFWTLTDLEGLTPREFARRWNSLLAHHGEWIRGYIRVLEPQSGGNPHYHVIAAVGWDMQPASFDWEAFDQAMRQRWETREAFRLRQRTPEWRELRRRYVASSAVETVALWKRLRRHLLGYGLGRSEFLPIRKIGAITEYVGKYLEAGIRIRIHGWKGARRIETDRRTSALWKTYSRRFSWVSPGAKLWRKRVAEVADLLGVADLTGIADQIGSRWAYWLRGYVTAPDEEWQIVGPFVIEFLKSQRKAHATTGDAGNIP